METRQTKHYEDVLKTVRAWSIALRITLMRDILETLAPEAERFRPKRATLDKALGLLAAERPAPSDGEIRQWLDEHRLEKYG